MGRRDERQVVRLFFENLVSFNQHNSKSYQGLWLFDQNKLKKRFFLSFITLNVITFEKSIEMVSV